MLPSLSKILVATDTSAADAAVEYAAGLARAHGAELQVLEVKPALDPREVYAPAKLPRVEGHPPRMEGRFPDLEVHTRQEMGDLASTTCVVAEQSCSDVIVIGWPRTRRKRRLPKRSRPRRVICRAPCSVLLVDLGGTN